MRLDRDALDRSGLDRVFGGRIVRLAAHIDGIGSISASLYVPASLAAHLDGTGSTTASLQIARLLSAHIDGTGDIYARLVQRVETRTVTFTGTLAAGKMIVIDGQKFTVINDGVNAIGDFAGDFPIIFPYTNALTYTDGCASRTVHIHVVKPGAPVTAETGDTLTFTYSGTLAAGKTLVIDGNDLTVENDGTNDLAHFTGDFPRIFPGVNTITYTDSAGARTMHIHVTRDERSI